MGYSCTARTFLYQRGNREYVPESFLPKISKNLYNVSAVREDGTIVERTVIFIKPVDVFVRDVDLTEFAGILLGKEIKK